MVKTSLPVTQALFESLMERWKPPHFTRQKWEKSSPCEDQSTQNVSAGSQGTGNICEPARSWSAAQAHFHHSWDYSQHPKDLGPSECSSHMGPSLRLAELSVEQNFSLAAPGGWKLKHDFLLRFFFGWLVGFFISPTLKTSHFREERPHCLLPTSWTSTFPTR